MTDNDVEARLVDLECRVAELQESLDELGAVSKRQWEDIERLQGEVKVLGRELLASIEGEAQPHIRERGL